MGTPRSASVTDVGDPFKPRTPTHCWCTWSSMPRAPCESRGDVGWAARWCCGSNKDTLAATGYRAHAGIVHARGEGRATTTVCAGTIAVGGKGRVGPSERGGSSQWTRSARCSARYTLSALIGARDCL